MASKIGFAYYNTDTDRYQDIKIKRLKKDFGCAGIAVYDYILCEIYRVKGCFIEWDENTAFDVSEYFALKESTVNEIVNYCCSVGLFDKGLLASEKVLTSTSIQKRFEEMCKRSKRKGVKIPEEYRKIPEESPNPPEETAKTPEEIDRVKKSRVKKSKVLRGEDAPAPDFSGMTFAEQLAANEGVETRFNLKPNIPTKQQVWECFVRNGGTKEMAKKFWDEMEATGWYRKGSPVRNFAAIVPGWVTTWKEIESGRKGQKNSDNGKPDARAVDVHELLRQRQLEIERDKANSGQHV